MEPSKACTTTNPSPCLSSTSVATALGSGHVRWTPTEEQLAFLDRLYRQGVRKPSADQIELITRWLRQHGHIEGKNVFYWFNRMDMRLQRQRQKQKRLVYFNKTLHRPPLLTLARPPAFCDQIPPPPLQSTTCDNVIYCPTCYLPVSQANAGNVAGYQQLVRPVLPQPTCIREATPNAGSCNSHATTLRLYGAAAGADGSLPETLQLFPLQPTFALPKEKSSQSASLMPPASASWLEE